MFVDFPPQDWQGNGKSGCAFFIYIKLSSHQCLLRVELYVDNGRQQMKRFQSHQNIKVALSPTCNLPVPKRQVSHSSKGLSVIMYD